MAASISSRARTAPRGVALRWPWPALLAWLAACAVAWGLQGAGFGAAAAWTAGALPVALVAWRQPTRARRALLVLGFAALAVLLQGGGPPPWMWLAAAAALALVYPLRAWGDAPLFPTPHGALDGLRTHVALPDGARVLDAGCGLGHGLRELRRALPGAQVHGTEWSWPLVWLVRLRCRFAQVRRGDLWAEDWQRFDLVYLFQRPESMRRAYDKAQSQMRPGSWLVSLEFAVPGVRPQATLSAGGGRRLCLYRITAARGAPVKPEKPD